MIQSGEFLGRLLGPLIKTRLPLIKNVIKPLTKRALVPLGLTVAASTADAGIHKKILRSGKTTLIITNDDVKDIIKIVTSPKDFGLLLKRISQTIKNEAKEQKKKTICQYGMTYFRCKFIRNNVLGNMLAGKEINKAGYSSKDLQSKGRGGGREIPRASYRSKGSLTKGF